MVATKPSIITAIRIRELFEYDHETGDFIRRTDYRIRAVAGTIITAPTLEVDGEVHKTIRYIWLHYYGEWPPMNMHVDHRNRRSGLNNIENLRLATPTQNQYNKSGSGTYAKGVVWRPRRLPWAARIRVDGERIYLGSFATEEEAAEAYRKAALEYHGEFACPT